MLEKGFQTPEEIFADDKIIFSRNQKHWDEIQSSFPSLNGFTLSMGEIGKTLIRGFITCPADVSEENTRIAMDWLKSFTGKIERNFRENDGSFYWRTRMKRRDENGEYDYLLFLEKTHPLNCTIKKVKKEVEVFESTCK